MQTVICTDLLSAGCSEPLTGRDVAELKKNIFGHLVHAHPALALAETQRTIAEHIDTLFPLKTKF